MEKYPDDFVLNTRGVIDVKGKGPMKTYWLEASESNPYANELEIQRVKTEAMDILNQAYQYIDNNLIFE